MSIRKNRHFLYALTWIAATPLALPGAPNIAELRTMLEKQAGLDGKSVQRLQAGQVVAKILDARRDSEIACLGAVVIAVPREYFLSQFRDIESFTKSPEVLQVGKLSIPPSVSDMRKLTLSRADIDGLKTCRPGNCGMKLSISMMEQIAKGMDGSPGAIERADPVFRAVLADYLKRYLADGNQALVCYADERPQVCVAKELSELLGEFSLLREDAPVLYERLIGSRQVLKGADDFLYWSKEKLGPLKPVVSVTQVITYSKERDGVAWSFIASEVIYASHYIRASVALTVLVDAGQGSVLMLYINRSRVDGLSGWLGTVKRAIVRHMLRSGVQANVAGVRTRLQRSYQHSGRPQ